MKGKIFSVLIALVLVLSFSLVTAVPVAAAITSGPTIAPVATGTDDIAGKEDAAYQITYGQNATGPVSVITVTFPVGYTITGGSLGREAVKNGDGSVAKVVTIGAENRAVDNVIGGSTDRTIAITLIDSYNYAGTETVGFQIVKGITNPTVTGDYGPTGLTVDDNAAGNDPVVAADAVTIIAGAATQVLVEDADDGTGTVVEATDVVAGDSITVYAITRDANDNFVENVAADWSLVNITGGVVAGDLAGSGTSATFTGGLVGTAEIHAVEGELTSVDSGTITVIPGAEAGLAFVEQPTDTVAGVAISPAVTVEIVDAGGNRVTTATDEITIDIDTGPGELLGTLEVAAVDGLATFNDLSIEETGTGYTLEATSGELDADTSGAFDIIPGAVANIVVTADPTSIAVGSGTSAITATVTDQYGNTVADGTVVSFDTTLGLVTPVTETTTNGVAETTLSAGSLSGTATVTATADLVSGNTAVEFTSLAAADVTVIAEPMYIPADGTSTLTITVTLVDEHGNTVPTAGATVYLETTAGALNPESGATEAGVFTSTLTSSTSPAEVTVSVNVGGVFNGSVAVDFRPLLAPGQIGLRAGWNAISLPLIPNNPLIEEVLADVENVEVVWAYDPVSRPLDPWFSYSPKAPPDLTEMKDGLGYWIKMSVGAILTVDGVVQPEPPGLPKTYPVVEGWNFIGFKSLYPMSYDNYLVNIADSYSVIWGYYDGRFYDVYPLEHQPYLMPGSGYWIWMTAEGIIVPPGE